MTGGSPENAVMINTAGRYATQHSDAMADAAGWTQSLRLLRLGRNQSLFDDPRPIRQSR